MPIVCWLLCLCAFPRINPGTSWRRWSTSPPSSCPSRSVIRGCSSRATPVRREQQFQKIFTGLFHCPNEYMSYVLVFKATSRPASTDACWSDTARASSSVCRSWWRTRCVPMCPATTASCRETSRIIIWWMTCWPSLTRLRSWTARWAAGRRVF